MTEFLINYTKLILLLLLNFIEGVIIGFISIIIAAGWLTFYYGQWNKFSITFLIGAILGFLSFLIVLAGLPLCCLIC